MKTPILVASVCGLLSAPLMASSIYTIIMGNLTWEEAKADAVSRGGTLAVLNTSNEIADFNNYLNSLGTWPEMFIGLTDEAEQGVWRWVNGDLLGADNWRPSEPNNAFHPLTGPEHYGLVISSNDPDYAGQWVDNGATYFTNVSAQLGVTGGYALEISGSPIPEPGSMASLCLFLASGLMVRRRAIRHEL